MTTPWNIQQNQISAALDEPAWLSSWRTTMFEGLSEDTLKKEVYGLSIDIETPEAFDVTGMSDAGSGTYTVSSERDISHYTLRDALAHEEIATLLQPLFDDILTPTLFGSSLLRVGAGLMSQGVVVVLPEHTDCGEVVLSSTCKEAVADTVIVLARPGARAVIVDDMTTTDHASVMRTRIVYAADGAQVTVKTRMPQDAAHVTASNISIGETESVVEWIHMHHTKAFLKEYSTTLLRGKGAEGRIVLSGAFQSNAVGDFLHTVVHDADHTRGYIRAHGIADNNAKLVYRGLITMHEKHGSLYGDQSARFLALSPDAEIDAIPALDIASQDVQCSHSVSVSHIKDKDIFYPQLRGIDHDTARTMLLTGFLAKPLTFAPESVSHDERAAFADTAVASLT